MRFATWSHRDDRCTILLGGGMHATGKMMETKHAGLRKPDPRIAAQIERALDSTETVAGSTGRRTSARSR